MARYGQIIPPNWSCAYAPISAVVPTGYLVANAQNIAVQTVVSQDFEWLFLHEDDVVLPPDAFMKINSYIRKADVPVVSGLYFLKANPTEISELQYNLLVIARCVCFPHQTFSR